MSITPLGCGQGVLHHEGLPIDNPAPIAESMILQLTPWTCLQGLPQSLHSQRLSSTCLWHLHDPACAAALQQQPQVKHWPSMQTAA